MKKVLLINPSLSLKQRYGLFSHAGGVEIPLGLCYLAASLAKAGFNTGIIDMQALNYEDEDVLKIISFENPRYVGFTATTPQICRASELAGKIKAMDASIVTIIGGNHVSALPNATLEGCFSFDLGVVGEGEETFCEAVFWLERKADIGRVKGLLIRNGAKVVFTGQRPRIKNLDCLAPPAFDLLPYLSSHYYLPIQNTSRLPAVSLASSRGCAGECTFCDRSVFGNYLSYHSAEYIIAILRELKKKYNIKNVMFQDDNFFLFKKRLADFCRLLKDSRMDIDWSASVRADTVDYESLKMAKSSRCWQLSYGIESANQRILDFYQKGLTREIIEKALQLTRKAGISAKGFIMFGNPLETMESIQETADFLRQQPLSDISITYFTPYPGTWIWDRIGLFGAMEQKFDLMTCFNMVFVPFGVTKRFLREKHREILRRFYLRPGRVISYMQRIRSLGYLRQLVKSLRGVLRYMLLSKAEPQLIVSADDFGMAEEVNAGIFEAYRKGRVDSVSLMANGEAFEGAVSLLKQHGGLDAGLHLTLVAQRSILPREQIPSLVNNEGYFYANYMQFAKAYLLGRINKNEIEQELEAQFDRVMRQGIGVSHIDSHQHIHMLPGILKIVIKCAKKFNINRIRYPYTPLRIVMLQGKVSWKKFFGSLFLNIICIYNRGLLLENKFIHPQYYCNVSSAGRYFMAAVKIFYKINKSGCGELVFHPGATDEVLASHYPGWRYNWQAEYLYLTQENDNCYLAVTKALKTNFRDFSGD